VETLFLGSYVDEKTAANVVLKVPALYSTSIIIHQVDRGTPNQAPPAFPLLRDEGTYGQAPTNDEIQEGLG
jgi:hypothetical protein